MGLALFLLIVGGGLLGARALSVAADRRSARVAPVKPTPVENIYTNLEAKFGGTPAKPKRSHHKKPRTI